MVTVIRPGTFPREHQFTARDYVSVPALTMRGSFRIWELAQFNADSRLQTEANAQRVIVMLTQSWERAKGKMVAK
jgi:hypothetical protein